jgi:hypothetical protein
VGDKFRTIPCTGQPCGPVVEGPPRRGRRPRRRHNAHHDVDEVPRDPMLSELGHAQAARRLADWCRIIGMVRTRGIYTSLHDMWYIISYIYLSIHLSIYLFIYLPTYILLILLQGGCLFDDWFYFLHTFVSIWRYVWSFFFGGINYWYIIVYYSVVWDHEVDKNCFTIIDKYQRKELWLYLGVVSTAWVNFGGKSLIGIKWVIFDTLWCSFTVDASLHNQPSALHDEVYSAQPFFMFQGI